MFNNLIKSTGILAERAAKDTLKIANKIKDSGAVGLALETTKLASNQLAIEIVSGAILLDRGTDKVCEGIDKLNAHTIKATEKVVELNSRKQDEFDAIYNIAKNNK